jgi:outer membrane protein OmpA-like peptidoglycan-associated protein
MEKTRLRLTCSVLIALVLAGCSTPTPGPDKTIGGAVLGAAWGAGTGIVVANQLDGVSGQDGAAIGAGFGAVSGAISGATYDVAEDDQLKQEKKLASLRVQNATNSQMLSQLQYRMDHAITSAGAAGIYQVYFDADQTSLRAGAIADLEVIAEQIRASPHARMIHVVGHTDDAGAPVYNDSLAEARARTVSAYLGSRGISMDQIKVTSHGAKRPVASNSNAVGRQLNRRVDIYVGRK